MRRLLGTTLFALLALAAPASAEVAHTVAPGESLWSIAAANNLTTRTVAAYNGLAETSTSSSARPSACPRPRRATPAPAGGDGGRARDRDDTDSAGRGSVGAAIPSRRATR